MKAMVLAVVLLCALSVGLSAPTVPLVYGVSTPLDYAAALGYGSRPTYSRPTTIYTGYSPYTYTYGYGYNYPYFLV